MVGCRQCLAQDGWNRRFSIAPPWRADGERKELPHHFFNPKSEVGAAGTRAQPCHPESAVLWRAKGLLCFEKQQILHPPKNGGFRMTQGGFCMHLGLTFGCTALFISPWLLTAFNATE